MKKTFSIITTVLLVVFLISALFTIVGCAPATGDAAKNETENQKKDEGRGYCTGDGSEQIDGI